MKIIVVKQGKEENWNYKDSFKKAITRISNDVRAHGITDYRTLPMKFEKKTVKIYVSS